MTTIIAKKESNGTVTLGYDSLVKGGAAGAGVAEKVWRVNGQFYLGVAGYLRYADILKYATVEATPERVFQDPEFDTHRYLVTEVVPAWQKALKDAYSSDPETREEWCQGRVLVVMKGRVYSLDRLLSVAEHPRYTAIGSGSQYAVGALVAGENVLGALEVAAECDVYTGGKLNVIKGLK